MIFSQLSETEFRERYLLFHTNSTNFYWCVAGREFGDLKGLVYIEYADSDNDNMNFSCVFRTFFHDVYDHEEYVIYYEERGIISFVALPLSNELTESSTFVIDDKLYCYVKNGIEPIEALKMLVI